MQHSEQEAIRCTLAGDPSAFRVLMDRHLAAVLRVTYRITRSQQDAEEAAQEAFLLAYKRLPMFREQAAFGTWVYRIAVNCSLNLVQRRLRDLSWNAVPLDPGAASENIAVSHGPTPEAELLNDEASRNREQAMGTLTAMERTAFVLRHMEEQPMQAVAEVLGVPVNSAKQAVFRAVAKLRRELAPQRRTPSTSPSTTRLAKESS